MFRPVLFFFVGDKSREGLNAIDEARLEMIRQKRLTELNNW
jgi:hypothetical protein